MSTSKAEFGSFLSVEPDPKKALEHLKRSISAIVRKGRGVDAYYIGKTSGVEPIQPIKRRFDRKKKEHRFTEDWALYESPCAYTVGQLEGQINEYYLKKNPKECKNTRGGSAGRRSSQPKHYIYLVLRRK